MAVRADVSGMLRADYRKKQALFAAYEAAADPSTRRRIAENARTELEHHSELEARVFSPAFARLATEHGRQFVDESLQEHSVVAQFITVCRSVKTS